MIDVKVCMLLLALAVALARPTTMSRRTSEFTTEVTEEHGGTHCGLCGEPDTSPLDYAARLRYVPEPSSVQRTLVL
jgi:hypothetical protein